MGTKDSVPDGRKDFGRGLVLWTYQRRREAAMGYALAARAEKDLCHHETAAALTATAAEHAARAAQMHAALWPQDLDPEALCQVPDMLELFQAIIAAIEHCDILTDAPEKSATLQWLAPYVERASSWLGSERISAGLAAIPKGD